eukprot:TRINITY_DN24910_c0_g1_i1.p1 TRINITY_DN24910_c0_g1~~TRINITY_DN24910_c0_g1_i1.p1  ORF type:complete len:149 (-),score=19.46 TRINITY_DN24910_c0_g1_i1:259-705(-)
MAAKTCTGLPLELHSNAMQHVMTTIAIHSKAMLTAFRSDAERPLQQLQLKPGLSDIYHRQLWSHSLHPDLEKTSTLLRPLKKTHHAPCHQLYCQVPPPDVISSSACFGFLYPFDLPMHLSWSSQRVPHNPLLAFTCLCPVCKQEEEVA